MERIKASAEFIQEKLGSISPKIAIITGSGLSDIFSNLEGIVCSMPYSDIPYFPISTVLGHQNRLVSGFLGGVPVICLLGRIHAYEGYDPDMTAYCVRVLALLRTSVLITINASGSLEPEQIKAGDIVVIEDHISLPSLTGNSPLKGPNLEEFGPRFPSMTNAYDPNSYELVIKAAQNANVNLDIIRKGIYFNAGGPQYETPAEARMLKMLGISIVGMSTIPEVIVAVHCGLKVVAISLVTNIVCDKISPHSALRAHEPLHEEVLRIARERTMLMSKILEKLVTLL